MQFSWLAWSLTTGFMILQAVVSACEGTFNSRGRQRVSVSFVDHGGMWGDTFMLPVINGLLVPYLASDWLLWLSVPISLGFAVLASVVAHLFWGLAPVERFDSNYIYPYRRDGTRWPGMSYAGWMHALFMSLESTLLLVYVATPIRASVVVVASLLLAVHVVLGTALVEWVARRRVLATVAPMLLGVLATLAVGVLKVAGIIY